MEQQLLAREYEVAEVDPACRIAVPFHLVVVCSACHSSLCLAKWN